MQIINKIATTMAPIARNMGGKISENKKLMQNMKSLELDGVNFAPNVFFGLMIGAVLVPRIMTANKRDTTGTGDEAREIFTRDVPSMLTLIFAMKGLKASIADVVSKGSGLVLLNDSKKAAEMNPLQKIVSYMRPKGISAMSGEQLKTKYGRFDSNDSFEKFANFIKDDGGDLKKVLTFDKKKSGHLSKLTEKIFGEDFKDMPLDSIVKKLSEKDVADSYRAILNDESKNELLGHVKKMNGWFEAGTLLIVISFLGIGISKINTMLTSKKYKDKDGGLKPKYEDPNSMPLYSGTVKSMTKAQKQIFGAFLGHGA